MAGEIGARDTSPGGLRALWRRLRRLEGLEVWYHPAYRLALSAREHAGRFDPRRSDYVAWYLRERCLGARLRTPEPVTFSQLARLHEESYLASLLDPHVLARIFGVEFLDLPSEQLLRSVRLACGGTLEATRAALASGRPTLNLLGGFHHAGRARGGGACAVNDVAVALAAARAEGFSGRVLVLDLDAHPPDGLADCLAGDPRVHILSLSGSDWGPLPGVDETVLAKGCDDRAYLAALGGLLQRRPPAELAFVLAGGDVLAEDALGVLGLTFEGARERDRQVAAALRGVPSVWLPGGGYRPDAWRVLLGTALVLLGRPRRRIGDEHPLSMHFSSVADGLDPLKLSGDDDAITEADVALLSPGRPAGEPRLLGYYTAQGLEYALHRYGYLEQLERRGYSKLAVELQPASDGDCLKLFGFGGGQRHLLVEVVASRKELVGHPVLFVNWLSLRHPLARFGDRHPRLPGQEVPGLGLARETTELLALMARRLGLTGVAFVPSWFHTAFAVRDLARFVDPARQGRFEALSRDLASLSLTEATSAVADGRVRLNGAAYRWEAEEMVHWLEPGAHPLDPGAVAAARDGARFTL